MALGIKTLIRLLFAVALLNFISHGQEEERPAPPPPPPAPKRISGGGLNAKAIELPAPLFPAEARAMNLAGTVSVRVVINESGIVTSAKAISGPEPLRAAAEDAARRAKFSPTRLAGVPVKVEGVIHYNFKNPEATEIGDEEERYIWSLGMFFAVAAADDDQINLQFGGRDELDKLLIDLTEDLPPAFVPHRPLFEKVVNSSGADRGEAVAELTSSLKTSLTIDQQWQVDLGSAIGNLMIALSRAAQKYELTGEIDSNEIKAYLSEVEGFVQKAPKDFAPDVLAKIGQISERNSGAMASPEDLTALMTSILDLIDMLPAS